MTSTPSDADTTRPKRHRAWALAVVMWAFGLATTTLLVGLWGRSVASDETALSDSARAMLGAEMVTDRVSTWLGEAVATVAGIGGPEVEQAVARVASSPVADATVHHIVSSFVAAALAPPGSEVTIDVASAVDPLVPLLAHELEVAGTPVPVDQVRAAADRVATVVLETEESIGVSGSVYRARTVLTTVLVVGIGALVVFGGLAVALADDRQKMIRTLAVRLAVSALTFMVFLRVGAWAVDPRGGRAPLADGSSVLLASNHFVFVFVAGAATAVALLAGLSIRRRRVERREEDGGEPVHQTEEHELLRV